MQIVADTVSQLKLGTPVTHANLTMVPLLADAGVVFDYLTLDEALDAGVARVTEVSSAGSVPEIAFENLGANRVLLLDGEELIGAKQNRVLNLTILVPGHSKVTIPVSCVERGRWSYSSREFRSTSRNLYARARASKLFQVSESLRASGMRCADQSAVWEDIDAMSVSLNAKAPTSAMADLYVSAAADIEQYQLAFAPAPGQTGAVFAIDGEVIGVEFFDCAGTFRKLVQKVVGSYALSAVARPQSATKTLSVGEVSSFLARVGQAVPESYPAIGEGQDVRLTGGSVVGAVLIAEGRVVHLEAFAERW